MPLHKSDYPILEYDTEKIAVIQPGTGVEGNRAGNSGVPDRPKIPAKCLMTFFEEVLEAFIKKTGAKKVDNFESEMKDFPIYEAEYKNQKISLIQATVGSGSCAMMTDYIIGQGVDTLITCGSCGVLTDIPAGDVIIPVSALRDEGASYHYLPPAREVILNKEVIKTIKDTLAEFSAPYVEAKTWTTDAFYRETPDMITYRKEEGCSVVEMECASIAAVTEFRGVRFGQLLYSGDILTDFENYDNRDWYNDLSAREKLFYLGLEALLRL